MLKGTFKFQPQAIERVKTKLSDKRRKVKQHRISVGIHEEQGQEPKTGYDGKATDTTLVEVALAHEYGIGVPERSFLRTWFDQNIARMRREASTAMRLEMAGDEGVVEQQAQRWSDELVEWLSSGQAGLAELMPATMAARERAGLSPAPPLDATGQLAQAIRVVVESE